jgi:adenylate kinase family enzyme
MTQATVAESVLRELSPGSHLIVTGQIGCGKTTLARKIAVRLGLAYLAIDDYYGDADAMASASRAAAAVDGGWVAEANVWQIPDAIWQAAELVVFLDYPNIVHYLRIIQRCWRTCVARPTWASIRRTVGLECEHLRIVFLYANKNREGWRECGGITASATPVIRCASPRAADRLLARMSTAGACSGPASAGNAVLISHPRAASHSSKGVDGESSKLY